MRNLVPYIASRLETATESPLPLKKFIFSEDLVVACFCGSGMAAVSYWSPSSFWHDRVEWPLGDELDTVIEIHHDSIDNKAIVAFRSGDFVEVKDGEASVVGSLETPIVNCKWSPAGDIAVIVCESGKVIFLSTDFDLGADVMIGEHQMTLDDMKLAESHVSVGWGKKETQFQGRGARALSKDPTVASDVESRDIDATFDKLQTSISWRGDGSVVAINSCIDGQRSIRFFTHDGKLDSVSEPASQLLGLCAYEPRGALVATVRANGQLQFFERNGLKRYGFEIERPEDITNISWSSDSSILSIVYNDKVDLWVQKNWHWYRKYTVLDEYQDIQWHPELPKTMGLYNADEIAFSTWQLAAASDQGLVAVIDTNSIKVTPLAVAGIPPPMSFASLTLDSQPLAVAVKSPSEVAVALENEVHVLHLDLTRGTLEITSTYDISGVQLLTYSEDSSRLIGYAARLNEIIEVETRATLCRPADPVSVLKHSHYLSGTRVFEINTGSLHTEFREPCTDFFATRSECFGLARSGKLLHSSGKVLGTGVTSILAGKNHLLYTTLTTLCFVHFNANTGVQLEGPLSSEQSREIERGSLLVSIMDERMAVVLQAPRGNIETIYPRMLVLGFVRANVAALNYSEAFKACKIHRLDMNVLYDLNPELWENNIDLFVTQLESDANIDLFLSSLSDEDVTKTKYVDSSEIQSTILGDKADKNYGKVVGKTNLVLDKMMSHVSPACQITALAMKQPPALVEALEKASNSTELVKHLVFLSDADGLYRTALSVYRPRLALIVAQQAQMDPREYLPFLRARNSESEPRSKFNIDLFLRRFDLAVGHLIADANASQDEIADFVLKHDLHKTALRILRQSGDSRNDAIRSIMLSQAEIWMSASKYVDAGTNFELLGEVTKACDAYILGCDWRRALALPLGNDEEVKRVVERLVETCEINKLYADSAHLNLHYLAQPRRALELFCLADRFDDALLVSATNPGLTDTLKDQLRQSFGLFQELLADCAAQVPSQLRRLRAIRAKREEDMLGFDKLADKLESTGIDVADNLSLAGTEASGTTNASAYTRYTDKSSVGTAATNATRRTLKNQRRQDRKKARGKKGSVYEEDYLIASTARLVERLSSTRPELQLLVTALRRRELQVYANQLTLAFDQVHDLLSEHLDEIFDVSEEALLRFDDSGHEYIAARPQKPELPAKLDD